MPHSPSHSRLRAREHCLVLLEKLRDYTGELRLGPFPSFSSPSSTTTSTTAATTTPSSPRHLVIPAVKMEVCRPWKSALDDVFSCCLEERKMVNTRLQKRRNPDKSYILVIAQCLLRLQERARTHVHTQLTALPRWLRRSSFRHQNQRRHQVDSTSMSVHHVAVSERSGRDGLARFQVLGGNKTNNGNAPFCWGCPSIDRVHGASDRSRRPPCGKLHRPGEWRR